MNKNFQLVISGVGGQGILTVADILGTSAINEGINVVMSEVHGMSQRGGVVISEMKIGDFLSPLIADSSADAILSFEPVEAYRILNKARRNTFVVFNLKPTPPPGTLAGDSYPDPAVLLEYMKRAGVNAIGVPALELACKADNLRGENMVMLGALSAVPNFPVSSAALESLIAAKFPKAKKNNIAAFNEGKIFAESYVNNLQ